MQRIIQSAVFQYPRGPVSAEELLKMPDADWMHLKLEITKSRQRDPLRPLATCRMCKGAVYIQGKANKNETRPYFAHYIEAPEWCPWRADFKGTPDDPRAAQYLGRQESEQHRSICELIEDILRNDGDCIHVDGGGRYRRPAIEIRGRYPDVLAKFKNGREFAIEVQLSKPFINEIAARDLHYKAENVDLVWVFASIPDPLPLGFKSVIRSQRGNAFVFDDECYRYSVDRHELFLKAFIEDESGNLQSYGYRALKSLKSPQGGACYLEDLRSDSLINIGRSRRKPWFDAFQSLREATDDTLDHAKYTDVMIHFENAWSLLSSAAPAVAQVYGRSLNIRQFGTQTVLLERLAILFSISLSASKKQQLTYLTNFSGNNAFTQMINAKLKSENHRECAGLYTRFLSETSFDSSSLPQSSDRIFQEALNTPQMDDDCPTQQAAIFLFPEILDGLIRSELIDLGTLPDWANPLR